MDEHLIKKVRAPRRGPASRTVIKTWSRRSTITPEMVGQTVAVHNGKKFIPDLRFRKHGQPQVRGVCADAHVQGAYDQGGREGDGGETACIVERRVQSQFGMRQL